MLLYAWALAVALLLLFSWHHYSLWRRLGVPYLAPWPLLGNVTGILLMKESISELLKRAYLQHKQGHCLGMFFLTSPKLIVTDLELIRKICIQDSHVFVNRNLHPDTKLDALFSKTLIMLQGEAWRKTRTHMMASFTPHKMKSMFGTIQSCGERLAQFVESASQEGPIPVKDMIFRYTVQVMMKCVTGDDIDVFLNPMPEAAKRALEVTEFKLKQSIAMMFLFFSVTLKRILGLQLVSDHDAQYCKQEFWSVVKYRENQGIVREDFLQSLMDLRQKSSIMLDGDDFIAQASVLLISGYETSAESMVFGLYELALAQEVQTRLRAEIYEALKKNGQQFTYEVIQKMTYLDMVVNEVLRKYPVVGLADRSSVCDYEIPGLGVTLPAGTGVFIPILGIHHDPQFYPQPDKFDPERFTEENKRSRPSLAYLPFGAGPRMCIGMRFGLLELKIGLVNLLSRFHVTPSQDTPAKLSFDPKTFFLRPTQEIPLIFKRIER